MKKAMRKMFSWAIKLSLFLVLCVIFISLAGYAILLNTVPKDNQDIAFAEMQAPTTVVFDKHAVPHIEGETIEDAYRALGYVHASERLWQMEFLRRVGQGRLSEVFGDATVDTDVFLRTIDMETGAQASFQKLSAQTQSALEAYASGVNTFMGRKTSFLEPSLPVEFIVLSHKPEKWEAWNSILILKVMGLNLSKNMGSEIKRLALASKGFSPREIEDVMPYSPRDNPPPLPDLNAFYGYSNDKKANLDDIEPFNMLFPTGRSASNNWVVSGDKTISGKPILANDPHLGLTAPAVFYLAHMSFKHNGEQRHLIGGGIAGTPFILSGRSNKVAWGLTTTNLDAQDIFLEQLNPENPLQYRTENGWQNFEVEDVIIKVSGGEDKIVKRMVTRHGPVLPDGFRNIKSYLPEGHVAALSWTGLASDDTTVEALFNSGLANTVGEYTKALDKAVSPMQSVVIADVEGNIGLATPARVPLRHANNIIKGRAPVPGWLPQYQWQGFLSSADVPKFVNPENGALTTANAKFFKPEYPHHITYDWASHYRQARAEELIYEATEKQSIEQSMAVMADDNSQALKRFINIAQNYIKSGAGKTGDILNMFNAWDGKMQASKAEPLIAMAWFRHFHRDLLKDDMGDEIYEQFARGSIDPIINILEKGTSRQWCGSQQASELIECGQLLVTSLEKAMDEIEETQGADWQKWQYGEAHQLYAEHNPFSKIAPLSQFFTIQVPTGGGPYTLHRGQTNFGKEGPYRNRHGAAYRGIYDLGDLDKSVFIQSTGQSGNVMSAHYRDFANKWANSIFIPMTTNRDEYTRDAKGIWSFK